MEESREAPPITQEMIALYDDYTHLSLDRRKFMDHLAKLAGSMAAAVSIAGLIGADAKAAGLSAEDDPRLDIKDVTYPGAKGTMKGYLAAPRDGGPYPAVIVVHENRGLNAHIKDIARRVALEGFVALAPDFLSDQGGTPADEDAARNLFGKANHIDYQIFVYEGANHAFNNDTSAARYDRAAANLAWSRTIAFLKKTLV